MIAEKYNNIVIFDTETSGLSFTDDQIIEFAAVKVVNGKRVDEIDLYIKLRSGKLDPKIVELTKITDEKLDRDGVDEITAVSMIIEFIGEDALMIAHNAQFDLMFLSNLLGRYNLKLASNKALDTLTIYKDRANYPHRLENAIEHYSIKNVQNSHNALDDVRALYKLLGYLSLEKDDLDKYINLFGYHPKYGLSGTEFDYITYKPHSYNRRNPLYVE